MVFEVGHERSIRETFSGDLPEILDVGVEDDYTVNDRALEAALVDALLPLLGPPGRSP